MVLESHVPFYKEIFALPNFLNGPVLCFGYQEFDGNASIDGEKYADLGGFFATKGLHTSSVDLFDSRAELRYDMNLPVPESTHHKYSTFIDIGSLEHLFDTRQCIENCFRMLTVGGHF